MKIKKDFSSRKYLLFNSSKPKNFGLINKFGMIDDLGVKREVKKIAKANCLNDQEGGLRLLKS